MKSTSLLLAVVLCTVIAIAYAAPVEDEEDGKGTKVDVDVQVPPKKGVSFEGAHDILREHLNRPVFVGVDIPNIFNFKYAKSPKGDDGEGGVGVNVDIPFLKHFQDGMKSIFKCKDCGEQKGDLDYP